MKNFLNTRQLFKQKDPNVSVGAPLALKTKDGWVDLLTEDMLTPENIELKAPLVNYLNKNYLDIKKLK